MIFVKTAKFYKIGYGLLFLYLVLNELLSLLRHDYAVIKKRKLIYSVKIPPKNE